MASTNVPLRLLGPAGLITQIPLLARGNVTTWTSMPTTDAFFLGEANHTNLYYLANYTQIQLTVAQGAAAASGAKIRLMYQTTYSQTIGSLIQLGSSAQVEAALSTSANQSPRDSGWITIASGALAAGGVYLSLIGTGAGSVASPSFGSIVVYLR